MLMHRNPVARRRSRPMRLIGRAVKWAKQHALRLFGASVPSGRRPGNVDRASRTAWSDPQVRSVVQASLDVMCLQARLKRIGREAACAMKLRRLCARAGQDTDGQE